MMELSLRKGREMPREVRQNMSLQDEKEYYLVCIGDQKLRQSKRAVGGEFYAVFGAQTRELIRFFRTRCGRGRRAQPLRRGQLSRSSRARRASGVGNGGTARRLLRRRLGYR